MLIGAYSLRPSRAFGTSRSDALMLNAASHLMQLRANPKNDLLLALANGPNEPRAAAT